MPAGAFELHTHGKVRNVAFLPMFFGVFYLSSSNAYASADVVTTVGAGVSDCT